MDRGRHREVAAFSPLANGGDQLLDEERVPAGSRRDPLACRRVDLLVCEQASDQLVALVGPQRFEQERGRVELPAAPAGTHVEELGPRHTQQEDRRAAGEVRDVLDQVEEGGLGPLEVVDHDDLGAFGGTCLEQPPERDPRLLGRRRDDGFGRHSGGAEQLDERPVRDPLAVVEAPPAEDVARAADPREEVGDEAGLADTRGPEQGEEPARALGDRVLEVAPETFALALAADQRRVESPRDRLASSITSRSRNASTGADFPFRSSGSTDETRTASRTRRRVCVPIRISPGDAACSSRAATFTASPTTNVSSSLPATTSPVLTPIRTSKPCATTVSRISIALRTARNASSSRASGTP